MKTKEELSALKAEVEEMGRKLSELSEDELKAVVGGEATSANTVGYVPGDYAGGILGNADANLGKAPMDAWDLVF